MVLNQKKMMMTWIMTPILMVTRPIPSSDQDASPPEEDTSFETETDIQGSIYS